MPPSRSNKPSGGYDLGGLVPQGSKIDHEIKIKSKESKAELELRLWKERKTFIVKEAVPYVLAYLVLLTAIASAVYVFFFKSSADKDERHWAMTILTASLSGVVGLIFGRATK